MEKRNIPEQYKDALLDFIAAKPEKGPNYHKFLLGEISKHFGFQKLLIFPFTYRLFGRYKGNEEKYNLFNHYVTLNMDHSAIIAYRDHIRHVDIFAQQRLSDSLKGSRALLRQDIVPKDEDYYGSDYQRHMANIGVDKEACIYIFDDTGKKLLATIGVFRAKEEPDFTAEDKALFEYLSGVITNQYMLVLRSSQEIVTLNAFDIFFKNSNFGSILVDHRQTVIRANERAYEISQNFADDFKSEKPQFFRSSVHYETGYRRIQELVDWIGNEIINTATGKQYASIRYDYNFFCAPYMVTNINSEIELYHLISLSMNRVHVNSDAEAVLDQLTARETEILKYLLMGYTNERIAEITVVSVYTIRTHISNIYRKFQVKSRVELLLALKGSI